MRSPGLAREQTQVHTRGIQQTPHHTVWSVDGYGDLGVGLPDSTQEATADRQEEDLEVGVLGYKVVELAHGVDLQAHLGGVGDLAVRQGAVGHEQATGL